MDKWPILVKEVRSLLFDLPAPRFYGILAVLSVFAIGYAIRG